MDMSSEPPFHSPSRPADTAIDHTQSIAYWSNVSSDVNGMLGGFPQTSRIDLQGSTTFLAKLRRKHHAQIQHIKSHTSSGGGSDKRGQLELLDRVADCGAGIGRITRGFLMGVAKVVDVVEPVKKFTDELVAGLESENLAVSPSPSTKNQGRLGEIINVGLQDWTPAPASYNLIWNQWCLGHLKDAQLVAYLRRCAEGLVSREGGNEAWIIVKENVSTDIEGRDVYDEEDSSVTRTDSKWRMLFKEAGLRILATEVQKGFPKELFPVRIYALVP